MGKAKLHGLLIDKVVKANAPRDACEFSDAELEAISHGGIKEWAKLKGLELPGDHPPDGGKQPY